MVRVPPRRVYRPLVERLEDRLPPGDAVMAGLLAAELVPHAERAAGLVPAGSAARPALSRSLAELAFPDAGTTFALLPNNEINVFSPLNRSGYGNTALGGRTPSLLNAPGITTLDGVAVAAAPHYNENRPLRDGASYAVRLADGASCEVRSPVVNPAAGAMAIHTASQRE